MECIFKASQWAMLSRTHAIAVIHLLQQLQQEEPLHVPPPNKPKELQEEEKLPACTHESSDHQPQRVSSQDNVRPSVPPRLCERLFSIFKGVRAADEMFLPCCLALLGYLPESYAGSNINSGNTNNIAKALSTSKASTSADDIIVTPSAAACLSASEGDTAACAVLRQQLTYSDWTNNAKNPTDFGGTFPTSLVQALRDAHLSTSGSSSGRGSGGDKIFQQGLKRVEKRDQQGGGAAININADQHHVVFLRKVKFPATRSNSNKNTSSSSSSTMDGLSGEQERFLRDWLPFILPQLLSSQASADDKASAIISSATNSAVPATTFVTATDTAAIAAPTVISGDNTGGKEEVEVLNAWLVRAAELLQQIVASSVSTRADSAHGNSTSYSRPPPPSYGSKSYGHGGYNGSRSQGSHYDYSNGTSYSYGNSGGYEDNSSRGSGGRDSGEERSKRDRDYGRDYDNGDKRSRY